MKFPQILRELREEKELSMVKLAKCINLSATAICNWENGKHDIKGVDLITLSKFFNVSTDYLLGLEK